ncbi:MAG TPA: arsinothricin resistance N-acetyltransferase ArsN1 family B [Candidatus Cybelea sp.]
MAALIRAVSPGDATAIAAIYRPVVENTTISFELEAPSEAEMRSRIVALTRGYPWLVAVDGGRITGYAYASPHRTRAAYASSVDVSVYVDESARRNGIGRGLYFELFARLAQARIFHRAFAGIALPNDASVAFHQHLGFEQVGIYREVGRKFGRWIDVSWWQRGITHAS